MSPHRVVPEALDDAVCFTREGFGEVVAEPGPGLIVLLALDVQCRCGHAYPGVLIHLVGGYEFPVVGFKHYSVSGEQMCCVRVFRYSGHGCEANQHGGVDCLLGNGWIGGMWGVILSDHVGGYWHSFPVAGCCLVRIRPVVLGLMILPYALLIGPLSCLGSRNVAHGNFSAREAII